MGKHANVCALESVQMVTPCILKDVVVSVLESARMDFL